MRTGNENPFHYYTIVGASCFAILASVAGEFAYLPLIDSTLNPWQYKCTKVFIHFILEVGIAGLVAVFIIVTIERSSRKNHEDAAENLLDRINENLFKAVYKRHIPEEVFSEVERCLLHQNFMRREYKIIYQIGSNDINLNEDGMLSCTSSTSYKIVNTSAEDSSYRVALHLEKPINSNWEDHCKVLSVTVGRKVFSEKEIASHTKVTSDHIEFEYETDIPPGKEGTKVNLKAQLVKQETDSEVWTFFTPSDGADLTVTTLHPRLDVRANALHSQELSLLEGGGGHTKIWRLDHGVFPYQSILFWWTLKDDEPKPDSSVINSTPDPDC